MMTMHSHYEPSGVKFEFDETMGEAFKDRKGKTSFGINSINNLISSMPEKPVLNIQC